MRIALATDAWQPQVNGVVRTLNELTKELAAQGHTMTALHPGLFTTLPCPGYSEIRLAIATHRIGAMIEAIRPDAIHIATEGPIGHAARRWCLKHGLGFTTAYHTRFPEYLAERHVVPRCLTYALLRRFHAPSYGVFVATPSIAAALGERGFVNLRPWSRGVDHRLFDPARRRDDLGFARPIFLSAGRVAPEKNLAAFLGLDLPGSKVVVGDGPALGDLKRRYPDAHFLGRRVNGELAMLYASADVFVFPSRTDTFGLVMIEALASGLPVAAFPVPGPNDVIGSTGAGVLAADLRKAALAALHIPRAHCREIAMGFDWRHCARQFLDNLCILSAAARSA
ncbi:MAG TPA: glycosyltransferase family 1 protein [Stellaceae bacterium]|nr:glycosyltransferase family 1 protein [Stellaceae bacterium]